MEHFEVLSEFGREFLQQNTLNSANSLDTESYSSKNNAPVEYHVAGSDDTPIFSIISMHFSLSSCVPEGKYLARLYAKPGVTADSSSCGV